MNIKSSIILVGLFIASVCDASVEPKPFTEVFSVVPGHFAEFHNITSNKDVVGVIVKGDGSGNLDCFILDTNDDIVALDMRDEDFCTMSFIPGLLQTSKIVVYNPTDEPNSYSVFINSPRALK